MRSSTIYMRHYVGTHTMEWKYKPSFELAENSVPRLHKAQYRNTTAASSRKTYMCHPKPKTGQIPDWKTNVPQIMSRNIYDWGFFSPFFVCYDQSFFPPHFLLYFHKLKMQVYKICPNRTSKQVCTDNLTTMCPNVPSEPLTAQMTCRAFTGALPTAVSRDSMTQSVPSRMALATSLASARVGRGLLLMLSNICKPHSRVSIDRYFRDDRKTIKMIIMIDYLWSPIS